MSLDRIAAALFVVGSLVVNCSNTTPTLSKPQPEICAQGIVERVELRALVNHVQTASQIYFRDGSSFVAKGVVSLQPGKNYVFYCHESNTDYQLIP